MDDVYSIRNNILLATGITALLHRYPVKLAPDPRFDFAGKIINVYHIVSHFIAVNKMISYNAGEGISCTYGEFLVGNMLDYIGWLAIFSRLDTIPIIPKTIANLHVVSQMMNFILGHEKFTEIYLSIDNLYFWNMFKILFILSDPIVRAYYHFYVLKYY